MTPLDISFQHLKAIFAAQMRVFQTRWLAHALPALLPRKLHAELTRALSRLEAMLRRLIIAKALHLGIPLQPFEDEEDDQGSDQPARTSTPDRKPSDTSQAEPRASARPKFRINEIEPRGLTRDDGPRILSFDEIIAMPPRAPKPVAEMKSTARLSRRLEAFLKALKNIDLYAETLAHHIAEGFVPYFRPIPQTARKGSDRAAMRNTDDALRDRFTALYAPQPAAPNTS
jgi:hypothetical protein